MASPVATKVKDFLTTDGKITRKGLLVSTALGGLYFGLPLYLGLKNIGSILGAFNETTKGLIALHTDFNTRTTGHEAISGTDFFKAKAKSLNTTRNWKIAGALALGGGMLIGANHYTTFENQNINRLSHYGAGLGILGNAVAHASLKTANHQDTFWSAVGDHLWYKTTDLGEETAKGAAIVADNTVKFAKATGETAVNFASQFADENDLESKAVNEGKSISDKLVTVCVNRTDYSKPVKDTQGKVTGWTKKTGAQAEKDDLKISAYTTRMNKTAEDFRKPDSDFRKALKESAAGVIITEPGHITGNAPVTVKPGIGCEGNDKEYRYNAKAYLSGQGRLPPNPAFREE